MLKPMYFWIVAAVLLGALAQPCRAMLVTPGSVEPDGERIQKILAQRQALERTPAEARKAMERELAPRMQAIATLKESGNRPRFPGSGRSGRGGGGAIVVAGGVAGELGGHCAGADRGVADVGDAAGDGGAEAGARCGVARYQMADDAAERDGASTWDPIRAIKTFWKKLREMRAARSKGVRRRWRPNSHRPQVLCGARPRCWICRARDRRRATARKSGLLRCRVSVDSGGHRGVQLIPFFRAFHDSRGCHDCRRH